MFRCKAIMSRFLVVMLALLASLSICVGSASAENSNLKSRYNKILKTFNNLTNEDKDAVRAQKKIGDDNFINRDGYTADPEAADKYIDIDEIIPGAFTNDAGLTELENIVNEAAGKGSVTDAKQKLNEGLDSEFIQADLKGATDTLSGVKRLISILVGIIAYAVILGMVLFTSMDLCYITMPVFREKTEQMAQSGNKVMGKTDKQTGETKVRWVTDEARYAVEQCSISEGKNPLIAYLKKRALAFVLVIIVIFILVTGRINIITDVALNFVSGVLDVVEQLGN